MEIWDLPWCGIEEGITRDQDSRMLEWMCFLRPKNSPPDGSPRMAQGTDSPITKALRNTSILERVAFLCELELLVGGTALELGCLISEALTGKKNGEV